MSRVARFSRLSFGINCLKVDHGMAANPETPRGLCRRQPPGYEEYIKPFDWPQARALLDGLPNGGINITHEAVDRHVLSGRGNNLAALDRSGRSGSRFRLRGATRANKSVANISAERGVAKGDRVFSLLGRVPELYIAALGTLKNGNGSSVA